MFLVLHWGQTQQNTPEWWRDSQPLQEPKSTLATEAALTYLTFIHSRRGHLLACPEGQHRAKPCVFPSFRVFWFSSHDPRFTSREIPRLEHGLTRPLHSKNSTDLDLLSYFIMSLLKKKIRILLCLICIHLDFSLTNPLTCIYDVQTLRSWLPLNHITGYEFVNLKKYQGDTT